MKNEKLEKIIADKEKSSGKLEAEGGVEGEEEEEEDTSS